jgi:predicted phage-related endonuclease
MTTTELTSKVREFKELQVFIKQLEEEAEAVKAAIIAEMEARETDTLSIDIFTVKWASYTSSRIDTTALKNELPEIAARYIKTTEARRFQVA